MTAPLDGLRVLEIATEISGPYAGKLFADAGADVVKVEPPAGDPMRRHTAEGELAGEDSALFRYLNTSKRSVVGDAAAAEIQALAAAADVIIVDRAVSDATLALLRANPLRSRRFHHAIRTHRTMGVGRGHRVHAAGKLRIVRRPGGHRRSSTSSGWPAGRMDRWCLRGRRGHRLCASGKGRRRR